VQKYKTTLQGKTQDQEPQDSEKEMEDKRKKRKMDEYGKWRRRSWFERERRGVHGCLIAIETGTGSGGPGETAGHDDGDAMQAREGGLAGDASKQASCFGAR
jgi:hypothetical protein